MEYKSAFMVYVTKYALTKGIQERMVMLTTIDDMVGDVEHSLICYHGEGRDWHRTRESAVKRAEEMRKKKIASLKRNITKFEKLTFE